MNQVTWYSVKDKPVPSNEKILISCEKELKIGSITTILGARTFGLFIKAKTVQPKKSNPGELDTNGYLKEGFYEWTLMADIPKLITGHNITHWAEMIKFPE